MLEITRGGEARGEETGGGSRARGGCAHFMHGRSRGRGGCTQFVHGRSRMTIDPRIPTMPGRSTSGFHRPGVVEGGGWKWCRLGVVFVVAAVVVAAVVVAAAVVVVVVVPPWSRGDNWGMFLCGCYR